MPSPRLASPFGYLQQCARRRGRGSNDFEGRTILLTGGTGSFGQHFTRTAPSKWNPAAVRIFSRDELKQYEMARGFDDPRLRFFIGDVRDIDRLRRAMRGVDVVIHAAALKQVPSASTTPSRRSRPTSWAANVVKVCIDAGVPRAIALSTDKAVSPVNLYGATKLCAEKLFVQANVVRGKHDTRLPACATATSSDRAAASCRSSATRQASGELTITDERMTRFWITLEQAVSSSRTASWRCRVARSSCRRSRARGCWISPRRSPPDASLHRIRPGEKLHESLITPEESRHTSDHGWCYIVEPEHAFWARHDARDGTPVDEGFVYSSDTNKQWLDVAELRELLRRGRAPDGGWPHTVRDELRQSPGDRRGTPIRERPLPYGRHHLEESDVAAVVDALRSGT